MSETLGNHDDGRPARRGLIRAGVILAILAALAVACVRIGDPMLSRAAFVAGAALVLWLTEAVPLFATTLLLWAAVALFLRPLDPEAFSLPRVLGALSNPVMALFFGGFALSAAGTKYGIDAYIAGWMVKASRGRRWALLAAVMTGTAVLSMWMSNIAAAAMMIATLRPLFAHSSTADDADAAGFRRALLLGVAFAADFGGLATPIGTGPNLIAIGAVGAAETNSHRITFLDWMRFGLPIAAVMLALSFGLILALHRVRGSLGNGAGAMTIPHTRLTARGWWVVTIFSVSVLAWLLEPLHGIPSALVAVAVAAVLFATRLLDRTDLSSIEWDTLLLIAGGLTLGQLFDDSGLAHALAGAVRWDALPHAAVVACLVLACASISAVASNTAAAAVLIQIALGIVPSPSVAVLVALGASMGVPFVISTPPNAMAYGSGAFRSRDLMIPGVILMCVGCAIVVLLGPPLLRWAGIP